MAFQSKNILVVEDEKTLLDIIKEELTGTFASIFCAVNAIEAEKILQEKKIDVVITDMHMPKKSGMIFFQEFKEKNPQSEIPWIFMSADSTPAIIKEASRLGALDFMQKPFEISEVIQVLENIDYRKNGSLKPILEKFQALTGIQLENEKKLFVETKIMRRIRSLGYGNVDEYREFFEQDIKKEILEIIAIIKTHSSEFFTEKEHFHYLKENIFPLFINEKKAINVWSVGCSTGEEVYSLAMTYFEFIEEKKIPFDQAPQIKIYGIDIDFLSLEIAEKALYKKNVVESLPSPLFEKYFDCNVVSEVDKVKVKDFVRKVCLFKQANVLSNKFKVENADIIFLRNILVYFRQEDIDIIIERMGMSLSPRGYLFLGQSESLKNEEIDLEMVSNSIYQKKK